jgi:Domain of unknown function (DUF1905)
MKTTSFRGKLHRPEGAGTWTYVTAPIDVEAVFGARGPIAVRGSIDGEPFRGSLMPHGDGRHFMVVNVILRRTGTSYRSRISLLIYLVNCRISTRPICIWDPCVQPNSAAFSAGYLGSARVPLPYTFTANRRVLTPQNDLGSLRGPFRTDELELASLLLGR